MKYKEITINTNTQASELVAEILAELGSKGVGIYDKNDINEILKSDIIWDYIDENLFIKNPIVQVKGYFECEIFENTIKSLYESLNFLKQNCPFEYGSLEVVSHDVDDEDWINVWKQYYKPINAGNITIVPNWINYEPTCNDQFIVRMDPGMAFGTGEHESTKMCLMLMQDVGIKDKKVIDIGTGSGILGIAAAKCGAKFVEAYDIDQKAVSVARANAIVNGVDSIFKANDSNMLSNVKGKYDIVLANITSDVLINMSESLKNYVSGNASIIISGIILQREQEVREAFLSKQYKIVERINMGEWVAFKLRV